MLSKDFGEGISDVLKIEALKRSECIVGEVHPDILRDVWIVLCKSDGKLLWEELFDTLAFGVVFRVEVDVVTIVVEPELDFTIPPCGSDSLDQQSL